MEKKQGMYVGAKYCYVVTCKVALYQCASFVPSPSHRPPFFDRLLYAKTKRESLVHFIMSI